MKCPVCQSSTLEHHEAEAELSTSRCSQCEGQWLPFSRYFAWLERQHDQPSAPIAAADVPHVVNDSKAGKLCPECGCFLIRYRAGADLPFHLDHCGRCGGVWLDPSEWEALRAQGLHKQIYHIFSEARQAQIRRSEHEAAEQARLREHLGGESYERIHEIRRWIDSHPRRTELYAFLLQHESGQPAG